MIAQVPPAKKNATAGRPLGQSLALAAAARDLPWLGALCSQHRSQATDQPGGGVEASWYQKIRHDFFIENSVGTEHIIVII